MPRLEFWYDFASSYSYLSAMRVEQAAGEAGAAIVWRPFLLGPIFAAQGWTTSPFVLYPAKGRYMIRDIERTASARGLGFTMPAQFPAHSLKAARLALIGEDEGWIAAFTRGVFAQEFGRGRDIADPGVLSEVLAGIGLEPARLLSAIEDDGVKQRLKLRSQEARGRGIFGAPTFITEDGELFWGDDRLEQAMMWAHRALR